MTTPPARDQHGRFMGGSSQHPGGAGAWTPRVEIGLQDAEAVIEGQLTEAAALLSMGLDPDEWEVTGYRIGRWPGAEGETKESTRISVKRRARPLRDTIDLDALLAAVDLWTPRPPVRLVDKGEEAFVVCLADWQVGGIGPGGGSRETTERILALRDTVRERVSELRATGRTLPHLVVLGLGDLVESCTGFYSNQPFSVDLDNREQIKLSYMLVTALLREWVPMFSRVTIAPIGGNHGETRSAFKVETGPNDNKDVLIFEIVRDILAERPDFAHVTWQIPAGELSAVTEAGGVMIGYTHGHMFSGGANAGAKAQKWWSGQAFGLEPTATATILVSGHFHHFSSIEFSENGRTWFQTPAMDNGSQWFTDFSGQSSAPGTLTFRAGRACGPRAWDDLAIL